jgi:hypothetical protein
MTTEQKNFQNTMLIATLEAKNAYLESELYNHRWIPVAARLPTAKDGDKDGFVNVWFDNGELPEVYHFSIVASSYSSQSISHWKKIIAP